MSEPRLTGMLRAFLTDYGPKFNYEDEYLKRLDGLKARDKSKGLKAEAENKNELTWLYFGELIAERERDEAKRVRSIYQQFIGAVKKVVDDDEIPSEVLHTAAKTVYDICVKSLPLDDYEDDTVKKSREDTAKKELRAAFSTFREKQFEYARDVAKQLHKWREGRITNNQAVLQKKAQAAKASAFHDPLIFSPTEYAVVDSFNPEDGGSTTADIEGLFQTFQAAETAATGSTDSGGFDFDDDDSDDEDLVNWAAASEEIVDGDWLRRQCERFLAVNLDIPMQATELTATLSQYLLSKRSDADLQDTLLNLLGFSSVEFIELLLRSRFKLAQYSSATRAAVGAATAPSPGSMFTITTKQDKVLEKLRKKEMKRIRKMREQGLIVDAPTKVDLSNPAALAAKWQQETTKQPSLANLRPAAEAGENAGWLQRGLPQGTTRNDRKEFEEVTIPVPKQEPLGPDEKLVVIEEHFEEWAQLAFGSIKTLNRIQSKVFEAAYRSNENLLICAPTGAGKTNIALMTMLHEIGQHFSGDGVIRKDDFKIVYVAPMKALAAEMTENFAKRFLPLNLVVKELTGDMQLSKKEIQETQVIVTTPEKWDVITRKSTDNALAQQVKLLIIDEVHLLHEDRGAVIETLVARTLRQVEQTQSMIRIVGLSATLPNYKDVADFLRVNRNTGLFFFGPSFRPVPMSQQFVGVKAKDPLASKTMMAQICFDKIKASVKAGNQCMVFVHSRKDTANTARQIIELAQNDGVMDLFKWKDVHGEPFISLQKQVAKSRNREVVDLFPAGFGVHHAGMLRADRNLTEELFSKGLLRVLVCTATLAWGVNLPAHTVIIKGTQIYNPEKGSFVDLGMLDVMQIFGRAGRPQFDTSGEGIIITSHAKLNHYLSLLCHQAPIESQFVSRIADHLNAEIVLGTVNSVKDAVQWLSYTYLHIRMIRNPLAYGITYQQKELDPDLIRWKTDLIKVAAKALDKCKMIRYDERLGNLYPTDHGRVGSHFYIHYETMALFNSKLRPNLSDADIFGLIAQSSEFDNVMVREDEQEELSKLENDSCQLDVPQGLESKHQKICILLQAYISQTFVDTFSLVSDMAYVAQSAARIFRALFEIVHKHGWPRLGAKLLNLAKMAERRLWSSFHPLRQFPPGTVSAGVLTKLEEKRLTVDRMLDMTADELGAFVKANTLVGRKILTTARQFPRLEIEASVQPITRTVLKVQLTLTADFNWNDKVHSTVEPFWIWIEDAGSEHIYHSEYFLLHKKQKDEPQKLSFIIPIFEDPLPPQYFIHIQSDRWMACDMVETLSFQHLILPHEHPPHTELLPLQPLPVTCLENKDFEKLYGFTHFNPIQTQVFHTMFHTDSNALVGAPTGSGKTIVAELAMFKLFRDTPKLKVVYIAPLKALVRERMKDWNRKFVKGLGKRMVELTGDYTPDMQSLQVADIVTTTPEKWDGISRNWQNRSYVKQVGLIIIDEIHLLGEDRGPILEVIVSRMRYVSSSVGVPIRLIGLSTAMANAIDLADWLGIDPLVGLFNFRPSVRPVPLDVHISGFRGKHYCPRMASMNKPSFQSIKTHSADQPVLIFVSSRRQTRVTALELINFCASDSTESPQQFLHMTEAELNTVLARVKDSALRQTLQFGIGLHHAGLTENDKSIVEDLFEGNKIQVLVSTATLAWGVNLPAQLVIVKGTEFYDPATKRYQDYPITDVLQMMGRAGRPQFNSKGVAHIMVEESKKPFYKKFLYDPFPVESSLKDYLHDHINAEIVSGTIGSKQDAVDYITWTYFFRRLLKNPTFYQLEATGLDKVNEFLSTLVDDTLQDLAIAGCCEIKEDIEAEGQLAPTTLGRIAAFYYLHYTSVQVLKRDITENATFQELLAALCATHEYKELPVRHNEDQLNIELIDRVRWPADKRMADSPNVKANLLLQAHFSTLSLPISDYYTDTRSVLDQSIRILQAMVDNAADKGFLQTTLHVVHLMQSIIQGLWFDDSSLLILPHFREKVFGTWESDLAYGKQPQLPNNILTVLAKEKVEKLSEMAVMDKNRLQTALKGANFSSRQISDVLEALSIIPVIDVRYTMPSTFTLVATSEETQMAKVKVSLFRKSKEPKNGIHAPKFNKHKDESWWLVIGDQQNGELQALRRITFNKIRSTSEVSFPVPQTPGKYQYTLFFLSDSYSGVDQEKPLNFEVKAGSTKDKLVQLGTAQIKTSVSDTESVASEEPSFFDSVDDD